MGLLGFALHVGEKLKKDQGEEKSREVRSPGGGSLSSVVPEQRWYWVELHCCGGQLQVNRLMALDAERKAAIVMVKLWEG